MAVADALNSTASAVPATGSTSGGRAEGSLLVCLGAAFQDCGVERLGPLLGTLEEAVDGPAFGRPDVAYPGSDAGAGHGEYGRFQVRSDAQRVPAQLITVQPAATWLSAFELMRLHSSGACLLLGAEAESMSAAALRTMAETVISGKADLVVPRYALPSSQGLLNSAIISPLSRSLYGAKVRFPLALDFGVSRRMAEKLAATAQRFTAANQGDAIIWPVAEAVNAGFNVAEVQVGERLLPQVNDDLSGLLNTVVAPLFSDVEQRAAFWQRSRPAREVLKVTAETQPAFTPEPVANDEIDGLLESFQNGFRNLHEIWSLVLPPNSLVARKRVSLVSRENFALPDPLWARIVYDFVLAHRLRTLARNHLMGVMVPLYLGWVASHILGLRSGQEGDPEPLARAFEADKPYLVSRWRWPDRFNP